MALLSGVQKSTAALEPPSGTSFFRKPGRRATRSPGDGFGSSLRHRLDRSGEAALMSRGLVLMDDVLVRDRVDGAEGVRDHCLRGALVAAFDRLLHVLHGRAKFRAQARVVLPLLFALFRALAGRS